MTDNLEIPPLLRRRADNLQYKIRRTPGDLEFKLYRKDGGPCVVRAPLTEIAKYIEDEENKFLAETEDEDGTGIARPLTDLAARINDEHQAATSALREGVLHAIAAGDLLLKAKAEVKHGSWLDWLKANCEIPERTVQAYMRLARLPAEKRNAVADLPLREALSAIRSRQERLERAEEQESQPPPGPAQICTVGPNGEVLFGEEAASILPPQPASSSPATPKQIADTLVQQLAQSAYEVRDRVSTEDLQEAFQEQFGGLDQSEDIVDRALALVVEMDDQQIKQFDHRYKLYVARHK